MMFDDEVKRYAQAKDDDDEGPELDEDDYEDAEEVEDDEEDEEDEVTTTSEDDDEDDDTLDDEEDDIDNEPDRDDNTDSEGNDPMLRREHHAEDAVMHASPGSRQACCQTRRETGTSSQKGILCACTRTESIHAGKRRYDENEERVCRIGCTQQRRGNHARQDQTEFPSQGHLTHGGQSACE